LLVEGERTGRGEERTSGSFRRFRLSRLLSHRSGGDDPKLRPSY
jgi:hypothetical protein